MSLNTDSHKLIHWYKQNLRDLPWRKDQDPYRIWISEVMLQQTTVQAVLPYYERFMKRFPNLKSLATSALEDVLEHWAGLGYYSRARNLHKAAQQLQGSGFPKTFAELIEYPGFGPYTARAVSSLAFEEKTGVLDGNVIRILSRFYGLNLKWWETAGRKHLQELSDQLAQVDSPSTLNQAMMELGATICTPKNPTCLLCPWQKNCVAFKTSQVLKLPLPKPRVASEAWIWEVEVLRKKDQLGLIVNSEAPFLKGQLIFPGKFLRTKKKPKKFDFWHGITKYDIYVQVKNSSSKLKTKNIRWVKESELRKISPSSILQKVLQKKAKHL